MNSNLWTTMWFAPRQTIRQIIDTDPKYRLTFLIILGGIGQTLSNTSVRGMGDLISTPGLIALSLIAGPISGYFSIYIMSFVLHWLSHRMKGQATLQEIRTSIAWSWVPIVTLLPLWIPRMILFRAVLFTAERPMIESQPILTALYSVTNFVDQAIAIWSLMLLYIAISEVNKFSIWRGFGAVVLSGLIIAIPLGILMFFISPF